MEMWTGIPVTFSSASVQESGSNVTVNTGGVAGTTICVMSALDNGASFYQVITNSSGYTFTNVPKPYLVTVTKHNYIPFIINPTDVYIQNETIANDKFVFANNIYLGENVTSTKTQGPVNLQGTSNILLNASNDVYLSAGFEILSGSTFEIK